MTTLAEQIYEETKTLAEPLAREVLDFIGFLKYRKDRASVPVPSSRPLEADADWEEFEKLAGTWEGKFHREECYDRPILR